MSRMSTAIVLFTSLIAGCTSDPLGLRSSYRDRNVPPSANTQPISNPPIAVQPGGQLGQPVGVSQSVVLPQAAISNFALAQNSRNGQISSFPMLASAGGQFDGRSYPFLSREARIPGSGGAKPVKRWARTTALAGGLAGSPQEDLKYRGGRTIKDLKFINIYVGGKNAWVSNDWKSIDKALADAMTDQKLNNVIMQYFGNQPVTNQFVGSFFMDAWKPTLVAKNDLESQVQNLYRDPSFQKLNLDFPNTVINFMLPRGTILGDPSGGTQQKVTNKAIPLADAEDSTGGLGGYHGSAHIGNATVYYSVGVFSERLANGGTNGIPVFKENWKNVVATFYHELQEARTDPDVDDAASSGMNVLGWTSDGGNEIGDYPIAEAKSLLQVFQEVPLSNGNGMVPVQFCYSNAVHGPEGPIDYPHGMEGSPVSPPPQNQPAPSDPVPVNPIPAPGTSVPQPIRDLSSNWNQLDDYIRKSILKLLS